MPFRDGLASMQARLFAEFGEPATYRPKDQPARAVTVVFTNEGQKVATEVGTVITTRRPLADLRLSELAPFVPLPNRDELVIRGETWTVAEVDDDDGQGVVTLLLTKPKRYG